jgi:type II secretory ATPase GspE/PulE/Tfp pilus assembly ATPase PilB-like protein
MEAARQPWPALGVLLIRDGLVSPQELEAVLARQGDDRDHRISSQRLGEALVESGIVTSAQVARLVAEQHELPFVDLDEPDSAVPVAVRLPEDLARAHTALPVRTFPDDSVLVVVGDPTRVGCFDDIRRALSVPVRFAVAAPQAIEAAIDAEAARAALLTEESEIEDDDGRSEPDELAAVPEQEEPEPPAVFETGGDPAWPVLGSLLLRNGLVTEEELSAALAQQRLSSTRRLGEILVARGALTEADVSRALAEQHELPFVELCEQELDVAVASRLPLDLAKAHLALPIASLPDGALLVAVADPASAVHSDELRNALGVPLRFAIAALAELDAAIDSLTAGADGGADGGAPVDDAPSSFTVVPELPALTDEEPASGQDVPEPELAVELETEPELEADPEQGLTANLKAVPTSEIVPELLLSGAEPDAVFELETDPGNGATPSPPTVTDPESGPDVAEIQTATDFASATDLIVRALALGASAVHFAPRGDGISVLARTDGVLSELETISSERVEPVGAELGELARRPFQVFEVGPRPLEVSSAVLPTVLGDRVTFRVVEESTSRRSFLELIERTGAGQVLQEALDRRSGLLVFCGPAGSGRTTTLHAALADLTGDDRVVLTIEDSVEHLVPDTDQTEIDPRRGLTFASGLRTILRSDPDVVVVGELFDPLTARLATRAALAGRLVLTTLDAESAAAGVRRLLDFGLEPGPLSLALSGVVGQRLILGVCVDCRESYYASAAELTDLSRPPEELGRRLLGRGRGCTACADTGYAGDVGVFEVLPLSEQVRALVSVGASARELEEAGVAAGMRTLEEDAAALCLEGVTRPAEVRQMALRTTP